MKWIGLDFQHPNTWNDSYIQHKGRIMEEKKIISDAEANLKSIFMNSFPARPHLEHTLTHRSALKRRPSRPAPPSSSSSEATSRNLFLILISLLTHCHCMVSLPSNKTRARFPPPIFCQGEAPPTCVPEEMSERSLSSSSSLIEKRLCFLNIIKILRLCIWAGIFCILLSARFNWRYGRWLIIIHSL